MAYLQVASTNPGRLATDVELDPTISITCTTAVDPNSVTSDSVLLIDLTTGSLVALDAPTVANRTISFTPAAALTSITRYQVVVKAEVMDIDSNPMGKDFSWQFTTAAASLSAPVLLTPPNQSSVVVST